jgi:adenosylcobinamide-phosphate synthase
LEASTLVTATAFFIPTPLIMAALVLDALAGDPRWLPHPVVLIGHAITWGEQRLHGEDSRSNFNNGLVLVVCVIALATGATWVVITLCGVFSAWIAAPAAVLIGWTTLAMRGLDDAAKDVELSLRVDDEGAARRAIPALAGRDPERLDRPGLIKATIESVAENFSDGVIAPMLYLFIGGPAAAIAYKAINTLDSMIGYRNERYLYFGRAAARIDDVANFVPARLSAFFIVATRIGSSERAGRALRTCCAEARKHASPNAGYPEAAMAGALGAQLGGNAIYGGEVEHRATLGIAVRELSVDDIGAARRILRVGSVVAFLSFALLRSLVLRL